MYTEEREIRRAPNHVVAFKEVRAKATPESTVRAYTESAVAHAQEFGDPNGGLGHKDPYTDMVEGVEITPRPTTQVSDVLRDAQGFRRFGS